MSQFHYTGKFPDLPNKLNGSNEPVYVPDWRDLEERAKIMITYWQHVAELAKIEQAMDRLGIGGGNE